MPTVHAFLADSSEVPDPDDSKKKTSTVQFNISLWAQAFHNLVPLVIQRKELPQLVAEYSCAPMTLARRQEGEAA